MTADQHELFLERAAIYEYEAGMPRTEAERSALRDIEEAHDEPNPL